MPKSQAAGRDLTAGVCEFCGGDGWTGGELEPRRPCTGCNREARRALIERLSTERRELDRRLSELLAVEEKSTPPGPPAPPRVPGHLGYPREEVINAARAVFGALDLIEEDGLDVGDIRRDALRCLEQTGLREADLRSRAALDIRPKGELELAVRVTREERDAWKLEAEEARSDAERLREALSQADAAMGEIVRVEGHAGYLSGPSAIAEVAVDQAVVFLHKRGLLNDEEVRSLEGRGSLGETARAALSNQEDEVSE